MVENSYNIVISKDFSMTPGARLADKDFSYDELFFLLKILIFYSRKSYLSTKKRKAIIQLFHHIKEKCKQLEKNE